MSMLDSFFSKGFKAAKCKTLLKLTIPRIKLLRNRREVQLRQMRREIAKLLESGQEATARIRVEHIIREEKMTAAQEIIELFCELIVVRLPIIEAQRECPLDLKEAISSVCFAAPRCADLPELLQVQMLLTGKYGKDFVSAATELMPECGVNRQLVELLSVRAPAPDVKLKLLKEIAEEHELDWDPNASESELLKPHEDLLNGSTRFISGSEVPLPKEKHDKTMYSAPEQAASEQFDSDADLDIFDLPEVPKQPLHSIKGTASAPDMFPSPTSALSEADREEPTPSGGNENLSHSVPEKLVLQKSVAKESESMEGKQFVPFISSPPLESSASFSVGQLDPPPSVLKTKSETNVDLQDVLLAAQAAAETADRAAAAARSAASLAQLRISELAKKMSNEPSDACVENPFHKDKHMSDGMEKAGHQNPFGASSVLTSPSPSPKGECGNYLGHQSAVLPAYDDTVISQDTSRCQPQRLRSMDDETFFSYPNLFTSQGTNLSSRAQSFIDNSKSTRE
ncbi:Regulator of Vps4 activity in the MVB pathway protein [Forsythia ovata]|uniref:Regulator of Vps4 activity in the MVB pathway protein n=1 Tax=Forsythia ovata TaxID=205694 RepID=A0ABD1PVT4_9LAMI